MPSDQLAELLQGLFGTLEAAALRQLEAELEWRSLAAGSVLFRQGDPGDALFMLVDGRLRVVVDDGAGGERTVDEVGRGASVGEAALLTGEPRSATVYALRDSHLVRLDGSLFERVVESHPRAMLQIARTAARRSRASSREDGGGGPRTLALVPLDGAVPVGELGERLQQALARLGPAERVFAARADAAHGRPGFAQTPEHDPAGVGLVAWLGELEARQRYLVYEAEPEASPWTRRCVRQADRVVLVARAGTSPAARAVEEALRAEAPRARVELVLVHDDATARPDGTAAWLEGRALHAHHHVRLGRDADVARLARLLVDRAVGLVLGGGGARGFAHIGVIRAIEEAGIPVDTIGAASMGSVVGAGYALGLAPEELRHLASVFGSRRRLVDPTLPLTSFLAGAKLTRVLRELYGEARVEDLWRSFFAVATNLSRAEPVLLRTGPLWQAVRTSSALPGTFPPMLAGEDLLVDGALMNNLPIDVMREAVGSGTVIASNVVPGRVGRRATSRPFRFGPSLSGLSLLAARLLPFGPRLRAPGLLWLLTRSNEVASAHRARSEAFRRQADLLIEPALGRFKLLDFDAWRAILEAGQESGRERLAAELAARAGAAPPWGAAAGQ